MAQPIEHDRSLQDLNWPALCEAIAQRTRSDLGRQQALELSPAADEETAEQRLAVMAELLDLGSAGSKLPAEMVRDVASATQRLARGGALVAREFADIVRLLKVTRELLRFGETHRERAPLVQRLLCTDAELADLLSDLLLALDDEGSVLDRASAELLSARNEVQNLRVQIQNRLGELIARYREALQDGYWAERDGRYVLPVRADAPFRVEGIVLGTSSSGSTLYVEPHELGKLGNRLSRAEGEVERQVALVYQALGARLLPHCEELLWAQEVCVRADFLQACVEIARRMDAQVVPFGSPASLRLKAVRHPLLCLTLPQVVPSDLELSHEQGLVISGPNAGGKTVALSTLGLCALMQSAGLPLPVGDGSSLGFFEEVLCDIGDDQSLFLSLSTFSGHVQRVAGILDDAGYGSLVLLDELMGGTDPDEGAVLAIATVDALVATGAAVCVTTHYQPLKSHAAEVAHLTNAAVGYDFDRMRPTFVVEMGRPGASSALVVADKFGLPKALTQVAEGLLPEVVAQKRRVALQLEQDAQLLREQHELLQAEHQQQQSLTRKLEAELQKQKEARRKQLAAQRDELQIELRDARAQLRSLRKDADKVSVGQLRKLEDEMDKLAALTSVGGKLDRELRPAVSATSKPAAPIEVGQLVRVRGFEQPGEVLLLDKKGRVQVLMGVMKMMVPRADVLGPFEGRSRKLRKSATPNRTRGSAQGRSQPKASTVAEAAGSASSVPVRSADLTIDLRGQRVEEGLLLVDHFVDELLRANESGGYVLHGHGTGKMKEAVRSHLATHACVNHSRPAERDEGGDAFTVFWLGRP